MLERVDSNVVRMDEFRRRRDAHLPEPLAHECLGCFLARMLMSAECPHTMQWTRRFLDLRAPRATAFEARQLERGATCDCKVLAGIASLSASSGSPPMPCHRVRRGSTQLCEGWFATFARHW